MNLWNRLRATVAGLLPDCREASRVQSELLDHPLPASRRLGLGLHLLVCKWCRRYGRQIRFLGHAAREHQDELLKSDCGLSPEAHDRIKRRLRE